MYVEPDQLADIILDGYSIYSPLFAGSLDTYAPATVAGFATAAGCCRDRVGDVNNYGGDEPTIGDVSILVDHLFIRQTPLECYAEGDTNQSGGPRPTADDISISDVSVLIDYLFITGPELGLAACL